MCKVKVVHVVHDFLFGGIEAFLFYLTQAQAKNPELEVSILCCQDKDAVANKRIVNSGIQIFYVKLNPFDYNISTYKKILRITNAHDIAHLHIFKPLMAEALRFSKAKIIYTNHSAGVDGRPDTISFKAKTRLLVRFLNSICDSVTNNSLYTKDFWVKMGVRNPFNSVIYNGVLFKDNWDEKRALEEFPSLNEKFVVGTTSRFISWKRVEYLIEAFFELQKNNDDVILLLVGDGETREKLVAYVKELGITKKVIFAGFQTNVIDYQAVMNLCVFASSSEPFGLVAVECLHLGKPTIVFKDGGGITEIIEGIEKNFIVDDIPQLTNLLRTKYAEFVDGEVDDSAQKRIEYAERFNVVEIEKEFYDLYKKTVNI
jgi:glycosyltransferase involved in cell wall biosynthesis